MQLEELLTNTGYCLHSVSTAPFFFVDYQVFNGARPCITLDPRHKERAMIIQDNDGDWAIVVGSWFVTNEQPGNFLYIYCECIRDRPFNLKGGLWFFVSFRIFFSDNAS
jgi:hypothetical protein